MTRQRSMAVFVVVVGICSTSSAFASAASKAKHEARKAEQAFERADFNEAVKRADAGIAHKDTAQLRFIKGRALWALGKHEDAWKLMTSFSPGQLPKKLQDDFVVEYERMEKAIRKERKTNRKMKNMEASLQARRDRDKEREATSTKLWIASGVGLVLGIAGIAYGAIQYTDPGVDDTAKDQGLIIAGGGTLLFLIGGACGVAALAVSPSGPLSQGPTLTPTLLAGERGNLPGMAFSMRF